MNPISLVRGVVDTIAAPAFHKTAGGDSFAEHLKESLEGVHQLAKSAESSTSRFLNGEEEDLHQVALAVQKADLAFELMMQVRNKVTQAYQEVMRMQL